MSTSMAPPLLVRDRRVAKAEDLYYYYLSNELATDTHTERERGEERRFELLLLLLLLFYDDRDLVSFSAFDDDGHVANLALNSFLFNFIYLFLFSELVGHSI